MLGLLPEEDFRAPKIGGWMGTKAVVDNLYK